MNSPCRRAYPSDISDEEWAFVALYLSLLPQTAAQRRHDLREVFNAVRYLVRTGVPWRWSPTNFPPWRRSTSRRAAGSPLAVSRPWCRICVCWSVQRLGYTRYVAQGGDWGNAVTEQLALLQPEGLLGIHTNMPATIPDDIATALAAGGPAPRELSADEQVAWDQLASFYQHGLGYANEMANRPQTLYALAHSPVGLAAWMLDHDLASERLITRVFAGQSEGLSREDILDNVTLYWLTNTAVSSARLYWESYLAFFALKGVTIPTAVSVFPEEIYTAPNSWAEKAYPHLIHYNRLPKGGHFAAWEQPQFFCDELRASFRSLRWWE
jgi:transposase